MGTVTGLLTEARKHIGYHEGRTTTFGTWYEKKTGRAGFASAPWCDMFVGYCADRTSNLAAVGLFAYTPYHVEWFQKRGRWHAGRSGIRAGDIVFFNWDGGEVDHCGIVEKVLSGGRVQTIEGNTADMCARRIRTASITGYGRPTYSGEPKPPPSNPGKAPKWPGRYLTQPPIMRGDDVKTWQAQMRQRGKSITVDGAYGPASESVCRSFQREKRLQVDGVVGPLTWIASWS